MQYKVVRSKRKTLSLGVDRNGEVVVRAPYHVRDEEILSFVYRHRAWLAKQLAYRNAHPTFSDGEEIPIYGNMYVIAEGARCRLSNGVLYLPAEGREAALSSLLKKLARDRMKRMTDEVSAREGLPYCKLTITSARGRWGSCSCKRHISFTFRTAFLPDELAYYLVVHELCHTKNMNHSEKFWADVRRILPDYKSRRDALKRYLWAMDCL